MSKTKNKYIEKICVKASTEELAKVRELIEQFTLGLGFSEESSYKIKLVIDEICSNIIKHSYSQLLNEDTQKESLKICLELYQEKEGIVIRIIDQGPPFNPVEFIAPEIKEQIAHPHKGGLGIPLIKLLSDQISYRRQVKPIGNQLEIRFNFH